MNYIQHVEKSLQNAENNISKITQEILRMDGMSGVKTRHFYNNLLSIPNVRYLEVGTWKGSSVCSAMYGNMAKVVCIDNWSQFKGAKFRFLENFNHFKGKNNASFIQNDCFKVDVSKFDTSFNIYLYDGEHSYDSHYKALTHYYNCLEDTFIFVVDDWNWEDVRKGTYDSIKDLGLKILYEKEIRLTQDNSHSPPEIAKATWWNGIYVAVLQKTRSVA